MEIALRLELPHVALAHQLRQQAMASAQGNIQFRRQRCQRNASRMGGQMLQYQQATVQRSAHAIAPIFCIVVSVSKKERVS
jgi:hypothetical protein